MEESPSKILMWHYFALFYKIFLSRFKWEMLDNGSVIVYNAWERPGIMENEEKNGFADTVSSSCPPKKWPRPTPPKMAFWNKPIIWAALICIAQFFVFAIIGVVQGYSVQSRAPHWILLAGIFLLLPCISHYGWLAGDREVQKWRVRASFVVSFCIILVSIVGILQGRNHELGDEFYEQKNYRAAITMYEKEIDTWYLRLVYNYHEDMSLFGIAQSQCQLCDFQQARQTYRRLIDMARGYYKERGQDELAELDRELKNIVVYQEQLDNTTDDQQKASILFDLALTYRKIECGQKAREQYARIQTLNARESLKEKAREFAANESW